MWYILQDIEMSSHCGTHVEFPYHHNRHGLDAGSFPLERLIGDAVLLDFTHKQPGETVTLEELQSREGKIRVGDMVLFNFNCARFYRTPQSHDRPADRPRCDSLAGRGEEDQSDRIGCVGHRGQGSAQSAQPPVPDGSPDTHH